MAPASDESFEGIEEVLRRAANSATDASYKKDDVIFAQGDEADAVYYIREGRIKLTTRSQSREGVLAMLSAGQFFGEASIIGQGKRLVTATAMAPCSVIRIERQAMVRLLREQPDLAERFVAFLINQTRQYQDDLIDHLLNSSERRLARILLLLSNVSEGKEPAVLQKISQETLAGMVGTTRSRINQFMNKFRRLGLIEYNGEIRIHRALMSEILHKLQEEK